jgi:putative FmdB family regulatory protein
LPLYEYKCVKCGHRFEKIESHSASVTKKCPKCGAKSERQLGAPAIQFKGSGWYVTDYGGKGSSQAPVESHGDGAAAKPAEKPSEKQAEKTSEKKPAVDKGSSERKKK